MSKRQTRKIYGLIGRSVAYSWSPLIHNTAFEATGLPCCYTIFDIDSPELVADALQGARALGIAGFNVTIPWKKTVVPLLDELSPEAEAIGAVNTIVNEHGRLIGHNTDIEGFAAPLMPCAGVIRGSRVAVFGSGGAALAAIEAFRRLFDVQSVMLVVRNPGKAEEMLGDYAWRDVVIPVQLESLDRQEVAAVIQECTVVVNATPVGTAGRDDAEQNVVPDGLLHAEQVVYDMVYNPLETPLLRAAKAAGAKTIPGIEMLLAQAARSFHIWTGREMPIDRVREAVLEAIHS